VIKRQKLTSLFHKLPPKDYTISSNFDLYALTVPTQEYNISHAVHFFMAVTPEAENNYDIMSEHINSLFNSSACHFVLKEVM
jgi:hypothetical protein